VSFDSCFLNVSLTTPSYSNLLINMASNAASRQNNVPFGGGNSRYNLAGQTARQTLQAKGWTFTDLELDNTAPTTWDVGIQTTAANQTFGIVINGTSPNITVDWGNGLVETFTTTGNKTRTYATAGNYTVKISGSFGANGNIELGITGSERARVVSTSEIPTILGLTSMRASFLETSLTSIPANLFANNTAITSFQDCFAGCTSLTTIPATLFANNTAVINFTYCFNACTSLTTIPANLFANNTAVTSFGVCFFGCTSLTSIPAGLFDNNTAVTSFDACFSGVTLTTTSYSNLLINMASNATSRQNNVPFGGGNSRYNLAGQTARQTLQAKGWTFTDLGFESLFFKILNVGNNICEPLSSNCFKITNVGTNICAANPTNCIKINDVRTPFPPPPNNLTATNITLTSFTVNWNSVSTATSYHLDISTNPTFTTNLPAYNNLTINGTSQSVIGLIPGATYYIRVRSVNARGTSDNSGTLTQTTLSEAPAAPNTPTATNVTQTSFTANWNSVVGATSYRIDVSTTSNFSTNLAGYNDLTVNSTSQSVTGLTANTIYYIRVRATNGIGTSSSSSTLIQTTLSNILLPPSSLSTSNATQTSFTLSWNPVAGATSYRVDISTSPTFETNLSQYNNLSVLNSFLNVIGLTPATTYYMRVRTVNSGGTSSSTSPLTQATASGPPPAPTMLTAIDITQTSFTANWNSVVGATSYRIDVSTSLTFATNLIGYNNLIVSGTSQSITGLTAGTTYYVRVRAVSNGGESGNSSTLIQTTLNINIPAAPTNLNYRDLYGSYFTLLWDLDGSSWLPGTSLEHFILDVSPNINFSSFVNNYQNRIVTNYDDLSFSSFASLQITGLNLNTNYYARLKTVVSYNGNIVTSDNSSTLSLKTLPLNGIHFKIDNSTVTRTVNMPIQENLYANERYTIPLMFDPAFASGAIQSGFNLQNLALSIRNIIDEDSFGTAILGFTGTRFHLLTDDGNSEIQNYGLNWIFIPALENKIPTDELAASAKVR
jgi:hypothetical protein